MKNKYLWGIIYGCLLTCFTVFVLLDTFVIPKAYIVVEKESSEKESSQTEASEKENSENEDTPQNTEISSESNKIEITDRSYQDENISIVITEIRQYDTTIYVADVILSSPEYLQTAFANNTYGRNVTEKTSEMAENNNAIFAVNGDYYGAREKGLVVRDGVIYRSSTSKDREDLVIYADGSLEVITERGSNPEELVANGALHILSFGPGLVVNGEISVDEDDEVGQAMASNPRTAIGIVDTLHYLFVVSDGRTDESEGLSLYQLATIMEELGAQTAYNLDGGGSSTMWFNGEIINVPISSKSVNKERSVSDIVYIGY